MNKIAYLQGYLEKEADPLDSFLKVLTAGPLFAGGLAGYGYSKVTEPTEDTLEAEQRKIATAEWDEALATLKERLKRKQNARKGTTERSIMV